MAATTLSAVLDLLPDGVAIYDAQERLVLTNPALRAMFPILTNLMEPGISFEVLLRASIEVGDNPHALGHDREEYVAQRLREFRDPDPAPQEILLADGRWVRVQDQRLPDGGILCLRTDISQKKRQELRLQESEQRYRQLVDLTPDGIVVHDSQGLFRFLNKAGRTIMGMSPDESLDGLHVLDHATEESRPLAELMLRRLNSGEALRQLRQPVQRKDGTHLLLELSAVPFDSAGERLVLCLFRDITAEAAASLRLRESEARARSILETALDAIITFNDAGLVMELNPAAERIFQRSRGAALGASLADMVRLPEGSELPEWLEGVGAGGQRLVVQGLRADGQAFPAELAVTAVPLGPGRRYTAYLREIAD
ncbi:PAS domain S-box protein [Niveispirillum sp. SYP-B3756]|uniref:PAS domain S-box protein n=1 Tax=Niveispirillum sp. SYP-B3756 TaxID=2662178 RepID=UPI00135F0A4A|nr:PAS domain S-box protein [Niveispirillum sp. SYP-B3756]